jgi:hypothetical protein
VCRPSWSTARNGINPRAISLTDYIFSGNPTTGLGGWSEVNVLLALFTSQTPVKSYADQTALLANTNLGVGYLAFVASSSDGWAVHLYNGPVATSIANYTLLFSQGNNVIVDPTTSIVLNFDGRKERKFVSTASFAVAKTITVTNDTNKGHFDYTFTITNVAAVLTCPTTFKMADVRKVGNDITLNDVGRYKMVGDWDGTNWNVELTQSPYA